MKKPVKKRRSKKEYSILETFGISIGYLYDSQGNVLKDKSGKPLPKDMNISGYDTPNEHTPSVDPNYVFPNEETKMVLLGVENKDTMLLVGNTGTGKSSLIEQVAARLNYGVIKVSFDGMVTRSDLLGEWVVLNGNMEFMYGALPRAFQEEGTILLLDEWDAQNEEAAFVLQRPLQREDRSLMLLETNELIKMHPDNVIAATANTAGQGDDRGLYSQSTRIQNYAQINRFSLTIRLEYLEEKYESKILNNTFPDLESVEVKGMVKAVNAIRDGFSNGEVSVPLSTRDILNWAEKYMMTADMRLAAKYCFLNRMSTEDANVCDGIICRTFGF
jgi:cobaltochelatase CobS